MEIEEYIYIFSRLGFSNHLSDRQSNGINKNII